MPGVIFTGSMGAGKTIGVLEHLILPALNRGQRVVTDIPLYIDKIAEYLALHHPNSKFNLDLIKLVSEDEIRQPNFWFTQTQYGETITQPGDLIIIDEAYRFYGTSNKINEQSDVNLALRLSRKAVGGIGNFSTEIVFVTQDYGDLSRVLRNVCNSLMYMRKLDFVGRPKEYRVDVFADTRKAPERQRPISSSERPYNSAMYELYNSFVGGVGLDIGSGFKGDDSQLDERINIYNQPLTLFGFEVPLTLGKAKKYAIIALVFIVLFGAWFFTHLITSVKDSISPGSNASLASAPGALPSSLYVPGSNPALAQAPTLDKIKSKENNAYRLAGFYTFNGLKLAVISDTEGALRYISDYTEVIAGPGSYIVYDGKIIARWTGKAIGGGTSIAKKLTSM